MPRSQAEAKPKNCPSGCYSIHVTGMRLEDITCACGYGYYDPDTGEFISGDLVRAGYSAPKRSKEVRVPKKCFKQPVKSKSLEFLPGHAEYPFIEQDSESQDYRNHPEPLTRIAPSSGSPHDESFILRQRNEPKRDFFLPGEGISPSIMSRDIQTHLGAGATVRPYTHHDNRQGYLITSDRIFNRAQIAELKAESTRHEKGAGQIKHNRHAPIGQQQMDHERESVDGVIDSRMARLDLDQKKRAAARHSTESTYPPSRSDEQDRGFLAHSHRQPQVVSPSTPYGMSYPLYQSRPVPGLASNTTLPAPYSLFPRDTDSMNTTPANTEPPDRNYNLVSTRYQPTDQHTYTRGEVQKLVAQRLKDDGKSSVSKSDFENSVDRLCEKLNAGPQEVPLQRDSIPEPSESIPRSQQPVPHTKEYEAQTLPPSKTSSSQANTYPISDSYSNADQLPRRHAASQPAGNSRYETSTDTDYSRNKRR